MNQFRSRSSAATSRRVGRTRRPIQRILQIHGLLIAKRFPNCSTLAREIEVTPKTIQRDLNFMRDEMSLPLEYHEREHGYFYTTPVTEFPLLQLSRRDMLALFLARRALEPLHGTRLEKLLAESFEKIAEAATGTVSFRWTELDAAFSVKTTGVVAADLEFFSTLLDAVLERREVTFDYLKLGATRPEQRKVRPYHIGRVEQGWYLTAYDLARRAERTFALPRMRHLTLLKTRFAPPADFDAAKHLAGGFGVWSYELEGRKQEMVRLLFTGYAARVVAERQWHPSQEIVAKKDGSIEFRLQDLAGKN
ncbi:putative DNA-binding transcriptional regulator YafY [Roseimicrobium gellanilyticum]|uniref:Putative DNA-binding transcriptional regulator YafY n=1 Tax=Roseimicrobium gellanilyticum TaxID=748857 RepID=A0A366H7H3_9BACT|nr:WYL domain-containing protein [Roseimicrobium gellanilyticum]RBP38122.1 putative DNA-binding transcriptional regulator YafY [Roseimicrobium gellanilyticum]